MSSVSGRGTSLGYIRRQAVLLGAVGGLCLLRAPGAGAAPFAYVTNFDDGTVSVIDTATAAVTATIPVGRQPFGVAVHPSGRWAYVGNSFDGTTSVIDATTNTVVATVGAGGQGVAVDPGGRWVYVTGSLRLAVLDADDNHLFNTISGFPFSRSGSLGIAVARRGALLYVVTAIDSEQFPCLITDLGCRLELNAFDVSLGTAARYLIPEQIGEVGFDVRGVVINPSGTGLYVVKRTVIPNRGETDVVSDVPIGPSPPLPIRIELPDGGFGLAIGADGQRLYAASGSFAADHSNGSVLVIDPAARNVIASIEVGLNPRGVAVNPPGTRVYVANSGSNTVSVIDTATNTVLDAIPVGRGPVAFGQFIGPEITVPTPTPSPTATPTVRPQGGGDGCSLAAAGKGGLHAGVVAILLAALVACRRRTKAMKLRLLHRR
jgi:YVTN family beta-propeller protein